MVFLLLLPALAHSPHDVASLLSRAPDGSLLSNDSDILAWTDGDAQAFAYVVAPGDQPACAIARSRAEVIVGDEVGMWWSGDGGLSYLLAVGPGLVVDCLPGSPMLALSAADGLWESEDGKTWTPLLRAPAWTPARAVADGLGGFLVADAGGHLHAVNGDGEALIEGVDGVIGLAADAADPLHLLAGRSGAPLLESWDGGLTWAALPESPDDLRVLALDGPTMLGASEAAAVWRSEDGGATFLLDDQGLDELAEGGGGPHDGVHYFHLAIEADTWRLASFEGLYSKPAGSAEPWHQAPLDVIPRVRSVDWLADGSLLVGAYGGGVYRGWPDTPAWAEVSRGVGWPWPKQILAADPDGQNLFEVTGSILATSADGGETWTTAQTRFSEAGDGVAPSPSYETDGTIVVAGRSAEGQAAIARSTDRGATWVQESLPGSCTAKPSAIAWGPAGLLVACGLQGALASSPDGAGLVGIGSVGAEVKDIAIGPQTLLATSAGLYELGAAGPRLRAAEGLQVDAAAWAADGTLWFAVSGQGLYTQAPGADPAPLGYPLGDRVEDIDIAEDGAIAIATRQGAFVRAAGSGAWRRANPYDRVDDLLQHWTYRGMTAESAPEATAGAYQVGGAGSAATLSIDASHLRLWGATVEDTELSLIIDEGEAITLRPAPNPTRHLLWETPLAPGWHTLEIAVIAGRLALDGAERWTEGSPTPPADPEETAPPEARGCTCDQGGGLGILAPLLAAALTARRRSPAR